MLKMFNPPYKRKINPWKSTNKARAQEMILMTSNSKNFKPLKKTQKMIQWPKQFFFRTYSKSRLIWSTNSDKKRTKKFESMKQAAGQFGKSFKAG
jgi:hypothetical protein